MDAIICLVLTECKPGKSPRLAGTLAPPRPVRSVGGASVPASRRLTELFPCPNQVKDFSFERPVLDATAKVLAQRILLNIKPLLRIALAVAETMMPTARLKLPLRWGERPRDPLPFQGKLPFPIRNPSLDSKMQIARRTEAMQVIRHQQIITNQPRRRLRPSLMQKLTGCFVGKPRVAFVSRDSEQDDI